MCNSPGAGKLRIGTANTSGETRDIQFLADRTIADSVEYKASPAMMMGDAVFG